MGTYHPAVTTAALRVQCDCAVRWHCLQKLITFYSTKKINITCSETKNACNILEIYEDIYGIIMRSVAFPEMNASAAFLAARVFPNLYPLRLPG